MTAAEFKKAFALANNDEIDFSQIDDSILHGVALPDFKPVTATIQSVAKLIRWQARYLNGGWNDVELSELQAVMRHKVTMVG